MRDFNAHFQLQPIYPTYIQGAPLVGASVPHLVVIVQVQIAPFQRARPFQPQTFTSGAPPTPTHNLNAHCLVCQMERNRSAGINNGLHTRWASQS